MYLSTRCCLKLPWKILKNTVYVPGYFFKIQENLSPRTYMAPKNFG